MKNTAIILAGGVGKRMGTNIPKQYIELCGKPVLYYTIKAFEDSFIDEIVLVTRKGDEEFCQNEIVNKFDFKKVKTIVSGGKERYHSVINGIKAAGQCDYIYIHDGARPFVDNDILNRMQEVLKNAKACIAAMPVKDTIKVVNKEMTVVDTPPRDSLYMIQTPQAFNSKLIQQAYNNLEEELLVNDSLPITDDAMVVERYTDEPVIIAMGSYNNIKITSPEDIQIGEEIIKNKKN